MGIIEALTLPQSKSSFVKTLRLLQNCFDLDFGTKMSRMKYLVVLLFVISTVVSEETRRTCRQSLMLSLKSILEENANDVCTMDDLKTLFSPMIVEIINQQNHQCQCEAGPPGLPGRDGRDGQPGLPGRDGMTGEKGEKGDVALGPRGDVGLPGLRGPPGIQGIDGSKGENGTPGVDNSAEIIALKSRIDTI